ncbi:MAG: carboxylating nicotinate-nucleotide diphosphorylase [Brevinematales bacterium]|jgi:nicotinate-nucleotide pyrophosphorylase (carboxylating)
MPKKIIPFPGRLGSIPSEIIKKAVSAALEEDLGAAGDITSLYTLTGPGNQGGSVLRAEVIAKEDGIVCGIGIFMSVYREIDPDLAFKIFIEDGQNVSRGGIIAEITGNSSSITTGERTALNFLGLLSGISTNVNNLASLVRGTGLKILDTRKTLPGLRIFQKYAVAVGGGWNHRMGLFDMVLIKDNHIAAAGGIENAVGKARSRGGPGIVIEVEAGSLEEARIALGTSADIVMLDNMDNSDVKAAAALLKNDKYIEVSGNIGRDRLAELAEIGVDFVSMGSLTHTVRPLDLSLLIR